MQRIAFMMKVEPGREEVYKELHTRVWPELRADLNRAGCHNYSIFMHGRDLFAYMEVDDFAQFLELMNASEVNQRWQEMMSENMTMDTDPSTGFAYQLPEVFHLD